MGCEALLACKCIFMLTFGCLSPVQ